MTMELEESSDTVQLLARIRKGYTIISLPPLTVLKHGWKEKFGRTVDVLCREYLDVIFGNDAIFLGKGTPVTKQSFSDFPLRKSERLWDRSEHKASRLNAARSLSFLSDSLFELSRLVSVSYRAKGDSTIVRQTSVELRRIHRIYVYVLENSFAFKHNNARNVLHSKKEEWILKISTCKSTQFSVLGGPSFHLDGAFSRIRYRRSEEVEI